MSEEPSPDNGENRSSESESALIVILGILVMFAVLAIYFM